MNNSVLLNLENRNKLSQSEGFKKLIPVWRDGNYDSDIKVGNINYLIKLAHEQITAETSKKIITRNEWNKFYILSGKRRTEILKTQPKTYAIDVYHGRDSDALYSIAETFSADLKNYNINVPVSVCFNFVYIMIVDGGYAKYTREILTLKNFCEKQKEYTCSYADPISAFKNDIDAFIIDKKTQKVLFGVQILPESRATKSEKNEKLDKQSNEKFRNFKLIFGIPVRVIYSSKKGYIKNIKSINID